MCHLWIIYLLKMPSWLIIFSGANCYTISLSPSLKGETMRLISLLDDQPKKELDIHLINKKKICFTSLFLKMLNN